MKEKLRTILCFGDSNTNGCNPDGGERWPFDIRWPGVLQKELGSEFHVIEEGMGGRTTVFDDPYYPGRRGLTALPMILETHYPISLAIIMLGTNDCKSCYSATPLAIAKGAARIAETILGYDYPQWCCIPEVLLISPIHVGPDAASSGDILFDYASSEKSKELAAVFKAEAERLDVHFLDASLYAEPGADDIHLDADGHRKLAVAIADKVRTIMNR